MASEPAPLIFCGSVVVAPGPLDLASRRSLGRHGSALHPQEAQGKGEGSQAANAVRKRRLTLTRRTHKSPTLISTCSLLQLNMNLECGHESISFQSNRQTPQVLLHASSENFEMPKN